MSQPHEIRNCEYCGKPMERKRLRNGELQSWLHYNRQKYCDRECMKKAFREKPRRWESWEICHQRARQIKPTGSCEICGSDRNVDVHHIDGNYKNNDPENLQRVCRSCHMKLHNEAGKCKICGKKVKGYGYCNKHYIRYKKYGNPYMVNGKVVME